MSTTVEDQRTTPPVATHSGTTVGAGRSGKGLGVAAAVLAVVIAAGLVFAVNQGNDATVSDNDARVNSQAGLAESDRLSGLAEYTIRNDPDNLPSELKQIHDMIAAAEARNYSGTNVEKTRMADTGQLDATPVPSDALKPRLAHEFLESQRSPDPVPTNPVEGRAE